MQGHTTSFFEGAEKKVELVAEAGTISLRGLVRGFWDSIVFPAAGYGEIGLAIARPLFPGEPWVVEDLETTKALFVSEQKVPHVRVIYHEDSKAYEVFSRIGEGVVRMCWLGCPDYDYAVQALQISST